MTHPFIEVPADCPHGDCLDAVAQLYPDGSVLVVHPEDTQCPGYRDILRELGQVN